MSKQERIGLIGMGLVGTALAKRLLAANYAVRSYDLAEKARARAHGLGVEVMPDAQAVAEGASWLLLSLFDSNSRRQLLWGAQALAAALAPGTVVLDTTTGAPADFVEDAARLAPQGVRLVDVCLSGSSQVVERGESIALIGDTAEAAAGYAPLLAAFCKAQYHTGAAGQGTRLKLIVNLVFGLHRAVLAEALNLAVRSGFELPLVLEVLKSGETYSVAMDTKGPKMIAGVYEPAVARLAQHAKDVELILHYAAEVGARVPLSEAHALLIRAAVAAGHGGLDNAAILKAYLP
ncbi:MAG: NAD(P)-dependent oxidoreductase [Candidatus Hydrogenedentes bacterium]|nr:NAD(P)-dependent oxidoreductase [Candidatus Hydrogenedentota bacterium]